MWFSEEIGQIRVRWAVLEHKFFAMDTVEAEMVVDVDVLAALAHHIVIC